jgi:hypothetical protein
MACEIMLQRGKTRPNMLSARFETAADAIIAALYLPRRVSEPAIALVFEFGVRQPGRLLHPGAPRYARRSHDRSSLRIGHIARISVTTALENPRIQPET